MSRLCRFIVSCPDQPGLVAKVSEFLFQHGASIIEANHHTDHDTGWFFMRHEVSFDQACSLDEIRQDFESIANLFSMKWQITEAGQRSKTVIFASKETHCLADLLHRWQNHEMDGDLVAIVANHKSIGAFATWHNIPFYYVDFHQQDDEKAFEEIDSILTKLDAQTLVLARFMRIFPEYLCEKYQGNLINIHHSFLPAFVGAKPYHQAHAKGVKLIGATCHYVTTDLDQGPIIEQEVVRISHRDTVKDMIRKGKDCEKAALARGLRYHLQQRIILHQHKTIVFE